MLDQKLKPWMLEVNHTPSFNSDTATDEQVKSDLIKDTFEILQMSVEQRKAKEFEIRNEKKQQEINGTYKRMSVQEHCNRVRFDPNQVKRCLPNSGYRMIYPKDAPGDDPDLYLKIQKKAHQLWKLATGTVTQKRPGEEGEEKKKKKKQKKKKPKKKRVSTSAMPGGKKEGDLEDADDGSSENSAANSDEEESNWQGGPQAEEDAVEIHLKEINTDIDKVFNPSSPKKQTQAQQQSQKTVPMSATSQNPKHKMGQHQPSQSSAQSTLKPSISQTQTAPLQEYNTQQQNSKSIQKQPSTSVFYQPYPATHQP